MAKKVSKGKMAVREASAKRTKQISRTPVNRRATATTTAPGRKVVKKSITVKTTVAAPKKRSNTNKKI